MPGFDAGDIVRVPFPYTDRETRQHRPALVVSIRRPLASADLLWVVMITSAGNRGWQGDVPIEKDHAAAGLPVPSLVRTAKIATIDTALAERIGTISGKALSAVRGELAKTLGLEGQP